MKCTIPGPNARILAKAVHSFARIGNELFLEAQTDGLSIRTVNRTKSAFAMILFNQDFFSNYDMTPTAPPAADAMETDASTVVDSGFDNKCKVSVKSLLSVFKNMRQVEECRMHMDSDNYKLRFEFRCRQRMLKTHYVSVLEQESLQAVFHTDNMPNVLTASHKLFDEIVGNFQAYEEELTLDARRVELVVKNFVEGATVDRRYMRSQLAITPDEFESYRIGAETSITFSLRELRAILNFAEALSLDMSVNFETSGQPVVFCLRNADTFETNLVMSTLAPDIYDNNDDSQLNQTQPVRKTMRSKQQRPNETADSINISTMNDTGNMNTSITPIAFDFNRTRTDRLPVEPQRTTLLRNAPDDDNARRRGSMLAMPPPLMRSPTERRTDVLLPPTSGIESRSSLATTVEYDESTSLLGSEDVFVEFCEDSESQRPQEVAPELSVGYLHRQLMLDVGGGGSGVATDVVGSGGGDDDDDVIPMSPPPAEQSGRTKRRKMMKVFQTCFESTFDPKTAPGASNVLAYASDNEDG